MRSREASGLPRLFCVILIESHQTSSQILALKQYIDEFVSYIYFQKDKSPDRKTMAEILNANPTIRSASDLPSRRREPSKKSKAQRPFGLLSSTIPESAYTPDPFNASSSSENESSDDDEEVEPIDEQEIYGT